MSSPKKLLSVVAVVVLVLAGYARMTSVQAQSAQQAAANFTGRVLSISLRGNAEHGSNLEDVEQRQLAGEQFLVGKSVDEGWTKGRTTWVAVADIAIISEFESVEKYKDSIR
jgi:hypothetical protein